MPPPAPSVSTPPTLVETSDDWLGESGTEITVEEADEDELADFGVDIEAVFAEEAADEARSLGPRRADGEVTEELDLLQVAELAAEEEEEAEEELGLEEAEVEPALDSSGPRPISTAPITPHPEKAPPKPPEKPPEKVSASPEPPAAPPAAPKPPPKPAETEASRLPTQEGKKRRRPWFETFFNDDYLRTVRPSPSRFVAQQVGFIEQIFNLPKGSTILDVGCGLGLHALELNARGYIVVGLDLSLPMLSRAGDEAQDRGLKINFLHADMREMSFEGAFDAVLCWGTTFGYFDDDANRQVLERLYAALKPRGLLLMDVVNRDYVIRQQPNLVWFEGDGCVCMEETQFNAIKSRLEVKRTVILDDGRQRENYYSIRLYSLHELGGLMHQQGFRVASVSGQEATPNVYFGADSPRMILLAERRVRGAKDSMPEIPASTSKKESKPPKPPPAPGDNGDAARAQAKPDEDADAEELADEQLEMVESAEATADAKNEAPAPSESATVEEGVKAPEVTDFLEEGDTLVGAEVPRDDDPDRDG
jgi:SAM-dependent methyltransferase